MDRALLAKALGAIASYSIAREVPAVRVVFCDAAVYDQGYMPPEAIAGRVRVRGRGGTVLQPGIDLLNQAKDFPKDAPLLVITTASATAYRSAGSTLSSYRKAAICRFVREERISDVGLTGLSTNASPGFIRLAV